MPLTPEASGVFPIAPTPFNSDGSVDWTSADRLFEFYHGIGSDGVTVLGIMGEAPKLEPEESIGLVKRAVAKMGGKPIIVGVSAPGFAAMRSLARQVMDLGAGGVMIAPADQSADRRPDHRLLRPGRRGDRQRHPLRHPGLSADAHGGDDAGGDPQDHPG
jgi:hypothetical protein